MRMPPFAPFATLCQSLLLALAICAPTYGGTPASLGYPWAPYSQSGGLQFSPQGKKFLGTKNDGSTGNTIGFVNDWFGNASESATWNSDGSFTFNSGVTFNGPVTGIGSYPPLVASSFAGATGGDKIQAAHDSVLCTSGSCTIDTRGLTSVVVNSLTITKSVDILACGTWTVNGTMTWTNVGFRLHGCGRNNFTMTWNGATGPSMIDLQAASFGSNSDGFKINVATGKTLSKAIHVSNYSMTPGVQTNLASELQLRDFAIDGSYGGTNGHVIQPIVFDPFVQPKTISVAGDLNDVVTPKTITVPNCTGWPVAPVNDYYVLISDGANTELAVAVSSGGG